MPKPSFFLRMLTPSPNTAKWLVILVIGLLLMLSYFEYLPQIKTVLDNKAYAFKIGGLRFSPYTFLKMLLSLITLFWMASIINDFSEKRIRGIRSLKSGTRTLISKLLQIAIYFICGLIALRIIGIDLTALAVFSGAVGIGLGFGLQKITSNFVSGLILIFEQTLAIDDLIELQDGTSGFIRHLGARHTRIETFDGKEVLVPNEDFIINPITNLTYSHKKAQIQISAGISYQSDLNLAHRLMLEAAEEHPRCLRDPEPKCFLNDFAASGVIFLLQFWVEDVTEGRYAPKSDVMFTIWRKFNEHGVELAYPQRDIHIKSGWPIEQVKTQKAKTEKEK